MTADEERFTPEVSWDSSAQEFELLPAISNLGTNGARSAVHRKGASSREEKFRKSLVSVYMKGFEKGLEEARFWKGKASCEVADVIRSILEARSAMLLQLEGEVVRLSVAVAERVVKREIASDVVGCLKNQIESCIRQLDLEIPVQLRLNPEDVQLVRKLLSEDSRKIPMLERVRLVEDRRVEQGGCIMETEKGALRATISEQLNKLSRALEREYGRSVTEEVGSTPLDGS